jgi:tripartite-type tricarboxylate transporter receptor subunit TctC
LPRLAPGLFFSTPQYDFAARIRGQRRSVVNSDEFVGKVRHLGIFSLGNTPQELDRWMREQIARWAEIAKAANIKVD